MKKLLRGYQDIHSYLGLQFPQSQPQKGNFLLYPYSKVTKLAQLIDINKSNNFQEFLNKLEDWG